MSLMKPLTYKTDIDAVILSASKAAEAYKAMDDKQIGKIIGAVLDTFITSNYYLTRMVLDETHIGCYEDKIDKHIQAVEQIRQYFETSSFKLTESHLSCHIIKEPAGLLLGITPREDAAIMILYIICMSIHTRNPLFLSFHPGAFQSSLEISRLLKEAAVSAGLSGEAVLWPLFPLVNKLPEFLSHPKVHAILGAGSPAFVKQLSSYGKPCYTLTAEHVPAIVSATANLNQAATRLIASRSADYGLNYNSEQCVFIESSIYEKMTSLMKKYKAYFLSKEETLKITSVLIDMSVQKPSGKAAGKKPSELAASAQIKIPEDTLILCTSPDGIGPEYPISITKMMPVLSVYKTEDFEHSIELCQKLLDIYPQTKTCTIFAENMNLIQDFSYKMTISHIMVNKPASAANSDFLQNDQNLLCFKYIYNKPQDTCLFKIPDKLYFNTGSLHELSHLKNIQKVLIITDQNYDVIMNELKQNKNYLQYDVFHIQDKLCTSDRIERGTEKMRAFHPDLILAFGTQYTIDIAKGILLCGCFPNMTFDDFSIRYLNIRRFFDKITLDSEKPAFIAVPTFIDSGTETTPFFNTIHQATGLHYPVMNYDLTPDIVIADPSIQKDITSDTLSGQWLHLFVQAAEAYMSLIASDFTDAFALQAMKLCYERHSLQNASLLSGMAYGNALAGLTRAFSESIGETFHIDTSICDSIIFPWVVIYNGVDIPSKMQSTYPEDHYKINDKLWTLCGYLGLNQASKKDSQKPEGLASEILSKSFAQMRARISIPGSFQEYGINPKEYESKQANICQKVFAHPYLRTNPRYPVMSELKTLYSYFYKTSK